MDDDQQGWRPTNLMAGVDQKFAYADARVRTAGITGGLWGLLLVVIGAYQFTGAIVIGRIEWNLGAGIAAMLFALGAISRNLLSTAMLALLCIGEVPAILLTLGRVFEEGTFVDQTLAAVRIAFLPAVVYTGIQGYAGAYEYQKLRRPFSPRSWRAANPAILNLTMFGGMGLMVFGFAVVWGTNIMEGFTEPGAAALGVDGSLDTSSRLALHLQDRAGDVKPLREKTPEETREEELEKEKRKRETEEKLALEKGEQWKVDAPDKRNGPGSEGEPGSAAPSGPTRHSIELTGPAYTAAQEALAFAPKSDNVGCLTESLRRHEQCKDEECRHLAGVFVTACLPESKPTEGFCQGVPSVASVVETTAWRARLCDPASAGHQACHVFYANLQKYCHPEDTPPQKKAG